MENELEYYELKAKDFRKDYQDYFLIKKDGKFVEKYSSSEMDAAWKKVMSLPPEQDKIKTLENEAEVAGRYIENDPVLAIVVLLDKFLSVNPLFSGDGFTRTFLNQTGVTEYLLKSKQSPSISIKGINGVRKKLESIYSEKDEK